VAVLPEAYEALLHYLISIGYLAKVAGSKACEFGRMLVEQRVKAAGIICLKELQADSVGVVSDNSHNKGREDGMAERYDEGTLS
jgi:hypothetical protein